MPEPVRFAGIVEAYSTTAKLCCLPQKLTDNPFRDTVQISREAREKSEEFLSKLKEQSSSEKLSPKVQAENDFDLFHLSSNATKVQIRQAYLCAIKQYHPDNFAGLCPEFQKLAEEKSKQINLAYKNLTDMQCLSDPAQ